MSSGTLTCDPNVLTLDWVTQATSRFVQADQMRAAVSLALASEQNLLFSGPGGHGKSEFLEAVHKAIDGIDAYVKSMHQETSPDDLFGGHSLKALIEEHRVEYNVADSFLPRPIVVLEELFDATSGTWMSLKDVMTSRYLRNGNQKCPLETSIFMGATNKSPQEIAELGPSAAAFVERFAIQLEVKWDSYEAADFMAMFESVMTEHTNATAPLVKWDDVRALQAKTREVAVNKFVLKMLAHTVAELRKERVAISPRTARLAIKLIQAAAAIDSRQQAAYNDILAIVYLPGCQEHGEKIAELVAEAAEIFEAEAQIADAEGELNLLRELLDTVETLKSAQAMLAEATTLRQKVRRTRVPDTMAGQQQRLLADAANLCVAIQVKVDTLNTEQRCQDNLALLALIGNKYDHHKSKLGGTNNPTQAREVRDELNGYRTQVNNIDFGLFDDLGRTEVRSQELLDKLKTLADSYDQKAKTHNNGWVGSRS